MECDPIHGCQRNVFPHNMVFYGYKWAVLSAIISLQMIKTPIKRIPINSRQDAHLFDWAVLFAQSFVGRKPFICNPL